VDLPTYTNIWRIEKRLYKLYDFRLPAPLPITWIAVFAGITVPYIVFLVAIGLPFNHNLVWLYVLPPGVLTWLTTRPVIESKRLPELLGSQLRYLTEPRVLVRMAPLAERDQTIISIRVWRRRPNKPRRAAAARKAKRHTSAPPVAVAPTPAVPVVGAGAPAAPGLIFEPAWPAAPRRGAGPQRAFSGTGPARAAAARPVSPRTPAPRTFPPRASARGPAHAAGQWPDGPYQPAAGPAHPSGPARPSGPVHPGAPVTPGVPLPPGGQYSGQPSPWPGVPANPLAGRGSRVTGVPVAEGAQAAAGANAALRASEIAHESHEADSESVAWPDLPGELPSWQGPELAGSMRSEPAHAGPSDQEPAHPGPPDQEPAQLAPPDHEPALPGPPDHEPAQPRPPDQEPAHPGPPDQEPALPEPPDQEPAHAQSPQDELAHAEPSRDEHAQSESAPSQAEQVHAAEPQAQLAELQAQLVQTEPANVPTPNAHAEPAHAEPMKDQPVLPDPVPAGRPFPPAVRSEPASPVSPVSPAQNPRAPARRPAAPPADPPATAPYQRPAGPRPPAPAPRIVNLDAERPLPTLERALGAPGGQDRRDAGWRRRVKIVAGGHGPGKRDQEAIDRERARLPIDGVKGIVVLGCASGAGQTTVALMTGRLLAALRAQPVAALDLNTPPGRRNANRNGNPRTGGHGPAVPENRPGLRRVPGDIDDYHLLAERFSLTVIDPAPVGLPHVLSLADQLIIVAPATAEAPTALANTQQWLDAHGLDELAHNAVTVVNAVRQHNMSHAHRAESVAKGRCRAIVRIPYDEQLTFQYGPPSAQSLQPQARLAFTALAAVTVAGLATTQIREERR
jgi:TcpE family